MNIINETAEPVNLPKFVIITSGLNFSKCIIPASDDEPCTMGSGGQHLTQCELTSTLNAVYNKKAERQDKQVARHNAMTKSDNNPKMTGKKT